MEARKVVIIDSARIPFVKSFTRYSSASMQEMMTASLKSLVKKMNLEGEVLGDVALGSVIMNSNDWNFARECVLGSGLSAQTPAFDLRRACGTSLETIMAIANKIALGQIEVGIGGGVDSNSDTPITFQKSFAKKMIKINSERSAIGKAKKILNFRPGDFKPKVPAVVEPRTGLSMGQHCELMAKEWKIAREDQDQLAFESHQKGAKAYEEGFYDDLVYQFEGVEKDTILRPSTTIEKLEKLRPVFDKSETGTLTAGNSTALTDGASSVLLASEDYAKKMGWPILAYFKDAQASGVDFVKGEGLLIAPSIAVGKLLERNSMGFNDIDFFEIHEAFAAQALCTFKAWEDEEYCKSRIGLSGALGSIPREKLNIKGGSLALGHPFGATGGRIVGTLAKILDKKQGGRGLISICTGGGMGVAAILEKS